METRSDYERTLRRQVARIIRRLRQRQAHLVARSSEAQKAWFITDAGTPADAEALAELTTTEAFGCGAVFAYEAVISEMAEAARIARLAARMTGVGEV